MIRKYPAGDQDRDARLAPRRDTNPSMGEFGVIVYIYKLSLEAPEHAGRFYHPVNTPEEATEWLAFYTAQTVPKPWNNYPLYVDAWFVPAGFS